MRHTQLWQPLWWHDDVAGRGRFSPASCLWHVIHGPAFSPQESRSTKAEGQKETKGMAVPPCVCSFVDARVRVRGLDSGGCCTAAVSRTDPPPVFLVSLPAVVFRKRCTSVLRSCPSVLFFWGRGRGGWDGMSCVLCIGNELLALSALCYLIPFSPTLLRTPWRVSLSLRSTTSCQTGGCSEAHA